MVGLFLLTYDFKPQINVCDPITLITAVCCALHIVMSGRFVRTSEAAGIVTWQFVGAALVSFLAFVASGASGVSLTVKSTGAIIYLGFLGTLFCYFITVWVQQYVPSMRVVLIFSLEPVFAAMFGFLILQETLDHSELSGTVLPWRGSLLSALSKQVIAIRKLSFRSRQSLPLGIWNTLPFRIHYIKKHMVHQNGLR